MKNYQKPEAQQLNEYAEGVFMASGMTPERCRFGRKQANPGSDTCQECFFSKGLRSEPLPGDESARRPDTNAFTCPDDMPVKG